MESVRKGLRSSLSAKERRKVMMNDRYILLKRRDQLTGMQPMLLETWFYDYPEPGEAYKLKEDFYDIWEYIFRSDAMDVYAEWVAR